MTYSTKALSELVAPETLADILSSLQQKGIIKRFRIGQRTTTMILSKEVEISATLLDIMKGNKR